MIEIRSLNRQGSSIKLPSLESPNRKRIPAVFLQQSSKKRFRKEDGSMGRFKEKIREAKNKFKQEYSELPWQQRSNTGYLYLKVNNCPGLYDFLEHIGFIGFHETNSGDTIYQHQLIKYLIGNGHYLYSNGYYARKGEVEIHHLDNDPTNNRVENLKYVSHQLNVYCAHSLFLPYNGKISKNSSMTIPEGKEEAEKMKYATLDAYLKRYGVYCSNRQKLKELLNLFHYYQRESIVMRLGNSPDPEFIEILKDFATDRLAPDEVVIQMNKNLCWNPTVDEVLVS
jgi:hypothetical protein